LPWISSTCITYVSTFTEDGVLDIIAYKAKGLAEIRKRLEEARPVFDQSAAKNAQGPYRPIVDRLHGTHIKSTNS
jgi:hypothetical protein